MKEQHQTPTELGRNGQSVTLPTVPGVVDGLITTHTDADGSVSLQIRIKMRRAAPENCEHIEVVLDPEHCEALVKTLLSTGSAAPAGRHHFHAIPCSVGINLQDSFGDREFYRRPKAPA